MESSVLRWLLEGDPAIRWQTMRDLVGASALEYEPERAKIATSGWGKQFLDLQDESGTWGGGIYSPKWASTTYTLLTLVDFGIDLNQPGAKRAAERIVDHGILRHQKSGRLGDLQCNDVCVWGFYLHIGAYFGFVDSAIRELSELLIADQMDDGGWNCRKQRDRSVVHASFHTTFNVLEGLREANRRGLVDPSGFELAESRAMEFMLQHRMFKSDKTGEVINAHFTEFSYPPRWHYDVLRGLDYIRETGFARDPRLSDAVELLKLRERHGIWPAQNKHAGRVHFTLETPARLSRWNTLRAMRVLKACD